MGMSYDEYWKGGPWLANAYREAFNMRDRREEWARWRQGLYFYDALTNALVAAFDKNNTQNAHYPNEPYPMSEKEALEREERDARARFFRMRDKLMAEAERESRKRAAAAEAKGVLLNA